MANRSTWGITSLVIGSIALVATLTATYAETFRGTGSSHLLRFLDRLGLVSTPSPNAQSEMRTPSLFSLTDETALIGLLSYGVYLAAIAMVFAIWAEAKREDTVYLATGFILGSAAMVFFSLSIGMLAAGVGATALFLVRRIKRT